MSLSPGFLWVKQRTQCLRLSVPASDGQVGVYGLAARIMTIDFPKSSVCIDCLCHFQID